MRHELVEGGKRRRIKSFHTRKLIYYSLRYFFWWGRVGDWNSVGLPLGWMIQSRIYFARTKRSRKEIWLFILIRQVNYSWNHMCLFFFSIRQLKKKEYHVYFLCKKLKRIMSKSPLKLPLNLIIFPMKRVGPKLTFVFKFTAGVKN